MLQFEELKLNLEAMKPEIDDLASALGLGQMRSEIQQLENRAAEPGFWDDMDNSQKILQRTANLKAKVEKYEKLEARYEDALALIELGDEAEDESLIEEAQSELDGVRAEIDRQRLETFDPDLPRRFRRYGSAGLGGNAVPYVHPLGDRSRLQRQRDRLSRRR